jgi:AcrR family transcriptional regulator
LRQALLMTAEALLAEKGVEGFTLRECARRAGVSPAAPAHHFGNVTGLLTAIATLGFDGLAQSMEDAASASDDTPHKRLEAIGLGYIRFALTHPARFRVMFGRFPLDRDDAALSAAGARAFRVLAETIAAQPSHGGHLDDRGKADLVAAWSTVHGFVNLVLDDQMPFVGGKRRDKQIDKMAKAVTRRLAERMRA